MVISLRVAVTLVVCFTMGACASEGNQVPSMAWPANRDAIPDAESAILIALVIDQGVLGRRIEDLHKAVNDFEAHIERDPKEGEVWVVSERPDTMPPDTVGGSFIAAISKHDGRVVEFMIQE